jgi:hypothetical protein
MFSQIFMADYTQDPNSSSASTIAPSGKKCSSPPGRRRAGIRLNTRNWRFG